MSPLRLHVTGILVTGILAAGLLGVGAPESLGCDLRQASNSPVTPVRAWNGSHENTSDEKPTEKTKTKPKPPPALLQGKIVSVDEANQTLVFKVKSKRFVVSYRSIPIYQHAAKKFHEIPAGTPMHAFGKETRLKQNSVYLEQLVVLVAGPYNPPPFPETSSEKPHWTKGPLGWDRKKTVARVGEFPLQSGRDRVVCLVSAAKLQDLYRVDKRGRLKGHTIFIRGFMQKDEVEVDGKKAKTLTALEIIRPTTGIDRREYNYLLNPYLFLEEKRAGKR